MPNNLHPPAELRAIADAIDDVRATFALDTLSGATFTCAEADALSALLAACGLIDLAEAFEAHHADTDECGDDHHDETTCPECELAALQNDPHLDATTRRRLDDGIAWADRWVDRMADRRAWCAEIIGNMTHNARIDALDAAAHEHDARTVAGYVDRMTGTDWRP